jgi:hypothetical protein
MRIFITGTGLLFLLTIGLFVNAQNSDKNTGEPPSESAAELAKKLANPIASLISVPFQNNTDYGMGAYKGTRNTMNFQPVIPFKLSTNLNLITRYIIPIVTEYNVTGQNTKQSGLGDATLSAFLSPSNGKNGLTWGAGPAFSVPIATDQMLGSGKFGVGPTIVILKQTGGLTYGLLANQIWSVAGQSDRSNVSQMFLQPFFAYNWKSGAGINAQGEISQNWISKTTVASLILPVSAVTKFGKQVVSLAMGPRIPISSPTKADWG